MFFGNISKISKGTIKYHSAKEVEFNGILFGTWDEKIGSVIFSQQSKINNIYVYVKLRVSK